MKSIYPLLGIPLSSSQRSEALTRYTTSWLLPPSVLASLRLLFSLYAFTTIFFIFGWDDAHSSSLVARESFSFFTNLTYWGLAFYFLVSSLHTFSYARNGVSWLEKWPRPLQAAHSIFYTTITTFPFLVTIVFWVILYSPPWFPVRFNAWSNLSQHALNSLFCLFEILIPRTLPQSPFHLVFIVLILALYLSLAYLTHYTQGFYPYSFLDISKGSGKVAGYIIGILVAACIIFGLVWVLIWLRRRVTERVPRMGGKFSVRDRSEVEDVELGQMEK